jgi:hypothetical protein
LSQSAILAPILALVGWTILVLMLIPLRRFKAGKQKRIRMADFEFGESANVPGDVSIPNRNYMNLLEGPVLFYVVCIVCFVAGKADVLFVTLAWLYVAFRMVHSLIHLTYNKVPHRLTAFALSSTMLVSFWIRLVVQLGD